MTQNESRIWKHSGESQTNATSVTLHLVRQVIWGYIWRHTVEKTQTYATSVTLRPLMYIFWGHIWKRSGEKLKKCDRCDLHHFRRAIWTAIWKHTVEKSQTNITNLTLHIFVQTHRGVISKHTMVLPLPSYLLRCRWRENLFSVISVLHPLCRSMAWSTTLNPHTQWPPSNHLQCPHFHTHTQPWFKTQLQTFSRVINVLSHFQLRPPWRFTWKKLTHHPISPTSQGWRFSIWSLTTGASYFSKWHVSYNV